MVPFGQFVLAERYFVIKGMKVYGTIIVLKCSIFCAII